MRRKENPLIPSAYEYWYLGLAALAVLLVGNAKVLLKHFGFMSSSDIVGDHVSNTVGSGLRVIDTFNATPGIVTFITWGIVGLILFSLLQAFIKASSVIDFERELGSNRFIHPANFSRRHYWKTILFNTFLSFGLIILLLVGIVMYVLFAVPIASLYLQRFLILSSAWRLLDLVISLLVVGTATLAVYCLLKAALWQHHYSQC